jgi:hypothetical protein
MKRYQKVLTSMALALGIMVAWFWQPAHAVPMLQLTSGGSTVTITDGAGGDPLDGQISFAGASGPVPFLVNATGITKPVLGTANEPQMDLVTIVLSSGASILGIEFTETDFTGIGPMGYLAAIGGTSNFKVNSFKVYRDVSNLPFGKAELLTSSGPFTGAFSDGTHSGLSTPTSVPYSLTIALEVEHGDSGQVTSFNATLLPQPEPGTLLLFGTGLLGMFGYGWRRRKQAA